MVFKSFLFRIVLITVLPVPVFAHSNSRTLLSDNQETIFKSGMVKSFDTSAPTYPTISKDFNVLQKNKARYKARDPELLKAVSSFVREADKALKVKVGSVVEKGTIMGIKDAHDFLSMGPYWWPDPNKKDGLPYIRKDGKTNPEVQKIKDKSYLNNLSNAVETLGLAYFFTEDEKYARDAIAKIRHWFLDEKTRMNPNLNHGQFIPGRSNGRAEGIIDTRVLIPILDGIQLVRTSPAWTAQDDQGITEWFTEFLNWLQKSTIGKRGATLENNIGTAYQLQVIGISVFLNKPEVARQAYTTALPKLLEKQFDANGVQVFEVERTNSWNYSMMNLSYWFQIAQILENIGIDLWNYRNSKGKPLQNGFEWMMNIALGGESWEHVQYRDVDFNSSFNNVFRMANGKFKNDYILFRTKRRFDAYEINRKISKKPLDIIVYGQ